MLQPWLLAAGLLHNAAASISRWEISRLVADNPGCFHQNFKYHPDIPHTAAKADSVRHCQSLCHSMDGCAAFSFWSNSGDCYFSDDKAELVASAGAMAGRGTCVSQEDAMEGICHSHLPLNGFPGFTGRASNAAWPSGRQPESLMCWPRNKTGGYLACEQVTVLEDTAVAWPGKCRSLAQRPGIFIECSEDCKRNPFCPSWQKDIAGCFQGLGEDCFVRDEYTPLRAQRLQHGTVRVLMNLTGWHIVGLAKSFDNQQGYFKRDADAIDACKKECYSDIRCQYWQYTPKYGCWVEDASRNYRPPWPLTTQWAYRSTAYALDCVAGEYIQHICPEGMARPLVRSSQLEVPNCMSVGYTYSPPNMLWQDRSWEMSAETCQARCNATSGCAHFSYWPDGGCHLQDKEAERIVASDRRVISGPADCQAMIPTLKPSVPVSTSKPAPTQPPAEYIAEIVIALSQLSWLHLKNQTKATLSAAYAEALANCLGVEQAELSDQPQGGKPGTVLLQPGLPSLSQGMSESILLVTYVRNNPPHSSSNRTLLQFMNSTICRDGMVHVTQDAGQQQKVQDASAFKSTFGREHGAEDHTKEVKLGKLDVNILPVTSRPDGKANRDRHRDSSSILTVVTRWWPLLVGLALLAVSFAITVGVLIIRTPQPRNRGKAAKAGVLDRSSRDVQAYPAVWGDQPMQNMVYANPLAGGYQQPFIGVYPGQVRQQEDFPLIDFQAPQHGLSTGVMDFVHRQIPFAHRTRGSEFQV